jgi:hypothetical protein
MDAADGQGKRLMNERGKNLNQMKEEDGSVGEEPFNLVGVV